MTRTNAREIAVHFVFDLNYSDKSVEEMVDSRFGEDYYPFLADVTEVYAEMPKEKQLAYIKNLVCGVAEKKPELDAYIEKYAKGWKINRISRIAVAIMEVAVYEILYAEDVPSGVAINEAVEISKGYEDDAVTAFINGILGNIVKEVEANVSRA